MKWPRLWRSAAFVPLVFLPLRACDAPAPRVALSAEVGAALADTAWTVIRFGTPAAEPFEEQGLDVPLRRTGETWTDARRRVEIVLRLPDPRPRTAVLDLASYAGLGEQEAAVTLNGARVGTIGVTAERRRVRIELPAARQRKGVNRLGLTFSRAGAPRPPAGHRYAAQLFGLVVGEPSPALEALLADSAPPFSFWRQADGTLVQAGPSRLQWAQRWPGATLHVRGGLHSASMAGGQARLAVTVEDAAGVHELWHADVGPASPEAPEAWIPLPAAAGPQRLSVAVEDPGRAPLWVTWHHLDILDSHATATLPPPAIAAAETLRGQLADANVVLVVFDAARAGHFGCYGYARPTTPEVDRLAAEGVVFDHAYTPAVFTLSAMASVWTSRLPDEHHGAAAHDDRLPADQPTLAELLAARGVQTAGFVGNGMAGHGFGLDRGFDQFAYVGYRAGDFRPVLEPWIANARRPFFLYVHYRQPHTPLDPPPPFDRRFGTAEPTGPDELDRWLDAVNGRRIRPTAAEVARYEQLYDGNLAVADQELGWLRARLEAAGLWDRTLVIVAADHGEALHEHGFIGHNAQLYEESVRIPLVVRFPRGTFPRGVRVPAAVDLLDVAPTVADAFGLRGRAVASFRGRSLLDVLAGGAPRGELLARSAGPRPLYALTGEDTKYVFNSRYGGEELYDLRSDPGEQRDVAAAQPLVASVYRQRMYRLLLDLPGRWTGAPAAWRLPAGEREELRALGYVN